jgi:hydrogenase maturation protease
MRILVGGIGNVFLGDDGFGVEVVDRLRALAWPAGVQVADFGIRGIDLAYALPEYEAAVLVDAVRRGGPPGTLYVLEPERAAAEEQVQMHAMTVDHVLRWVPSGRLPPVMRIVGCEPETFGEEGAGQAGLSDAVSAAVDEAVGLVQSLVSELTGARTRA